MSDKKTLIILDPALKKGFTSIPNIVLYAKNLSMTAKCLYSILLSFAWSESECFPGQERLAEVAGVTDRTIRKYLDELKEYGLVSWVQRGLNQTNVYYINDLSKIEGLKPLGDADRKALSGPDRKGPSGQERKELSDKEYSVENVVVVEAPPLEGIITNENVSSTVTNSEMEVCSQGEDQEEKYQELPAWEQLRNKIRAVAGADISVGFAREVGEKYPPEKISSAILELHRQVDRGIKIRSVGAWLRYALVNDVQPDQPVKPKIIQAQERRATGHNLDTGDRGALTLHGLRHTFACEYIARRYQEYLSAGISATAASARARKDTAEVLGHGRIEITYIYAPESLFI